LYYQDKNIIMAAGALASFFSDPRTIQAIGEIGVGIFSANQASKSRQRAEEFLGKLEEKQANRQQITNPYANIENPYKNLAVATQAAKMQAEEADIALANTLDTLRATGKGAGGATALAQAALKSKQQISANIEQQEVANEKLKAQGQLQVDTARAKGEAFRMQMQESRDIEELDRLQYSADLAAAQQQEQANVAASGIISGASGLGAVGMRTFMNDKTQNEAELETENVNLLASNLANNNLSNIQNNYNPVSQLPRSSFLISDEDVFDPNTGRVIPRGGFSNINI
tara:strand:- start:2716 stop:3573 length:858 start_codon:yes stop_codon:yes gene_type:complete